MSKRKKIQAGINLSKELHAEVKQIAEDEFNGNFSLTCEYLIKKGLDNEKAE